MDITKQDLLALRRRYFVAAQGGIALPVAGAIYWMALAAVGQTLDPGQWGLIAAYTSGLIFPLGVLLQWPLRSNFMKARSPVSGVAWAGIITINFLWPLHFVVISAVPEAAPLSLAIGMTLHWPIIGWAYASRICYLHAALRIIVVTALWYGFPDLRLTGLPLAVAALYLAAAVGMWLEVKWTSAWLDRR